MTFEELKEMIDATINENDCGAITGKALNLALNEILNGVQQYVEENKPEVAGIETIYIYDEIGENGEPLFSDSTKAHNANVFSKCFEKIRAGEPLPLLQFDGTAMFYFEMQESGIPTDKVNVGMTYGIVYVMAVDDPDNLAGIAEQFGVNQLILLSANKASEMMCLLPDGTLLGAN